MRGRCGVRRRVGTHHQPVRTDEHGHALRPFLVGALGRAIRDGDRATNVAEEMAVEPNLLRPAFQVFLRAEGNAQQYGVLVGKFPDSITEPAGFLRSAVAECARVEPDEHVLSREIRQAHRLPMLVGERKRRRSRPNFR